MVVLGTSITLIAASQLLMKWRMTALVADGAATTRRDMLAMALFDPWVWLCAAFILASAVLWYIAMSRLPLSFMMPLAACTAPIVAVGAALLFGETLSAMHMAAIGLIAVGVAWLGMLQ